MMGRKLIRTMKGEVVGEFTLPVLGVNINRALAIRHRTVSTDAKGAKFDIVTEDDGSITNLIQGLSVCPPPKENMMAHLLRLKIGESYFCIDEKSLELNPHLVYIEDKVDDGQLVKHGIIAPRHEMNIEFYISCLSATRRYWEVLNDEANAEIPNTNALDRQLNAELKGIYNRSNL
ncbi:hypothetical protein [Rahnella aceris]|uniref:hypothetical protein n=1 Tax=Rahnella sp. (strain Y9602) TaxID=2703885 RepID=UPI001C277D77|nr:hypothetical protein [Rahnella aceris]MBU9849275.1 hypothetical protein [Rahnella aceris]